MQKRAPHSSLDPLLAAASGLVRIGLDSVAIEHLFPAAALCPCAQVHVYCALLPCLAFRAGSLPSTWSSHERLREVSLYGCSLTGSLPGAWGRMKRLRQVYLQNNKLTGTLPEEWGSLAALNNLGLATNELSGSIPGSWVGMRSLKSM